MVDSYSEILTVSTSLDNALKIAIDDWYELMNEHYELDLEPKPAYKIQTRLDLARECGEHCTINIFDPPDFIEWSNTYVEAKYMIVKTALQ